MLLAKRRKKVIENEKHVMNLTFLKFTVFAIIIIWDFYRNGGNLFVFASTN